MHDASMIIDLIDAFRRSKAMFAATALGVFEHMPATAAELAAALSADSGALERLLDGCVALGLLERNGRSYRNAPLAERYLRRQSPHALTGYILYSESVLYPLWANLADAVREGTNRWKQTHGLDGPLFSHFFRTPEMKREFLLGMHSYGMLSSPAVVASFDLSRFRRLVDLGGATGHLPGAAKTKYPRLQAAIFDLPEVIETVRDLAPEGVELLPGDFFTDPLPPADLYALGRILHDWTEPKIRTLLAKIAGSLPEGGGLLIMETLLRDDKSGPVNALMQSLNMLVCTEGKERTLAEYEALLQEAGFRFVEGKVTNTPLDAILALK
jgi:acetylserotonin N-methyltransferase